MVGISKQMKKNLRGISWHLNEPCEGFLKCNSGNLSIKILIFIENVAGGTCQVEMQT